MAILGGKLKGVLANLSAEAAELAAGVLPGVVVVRGGMGGQGSGVVWREGGIVLTNDHVVPGDRAEVSMVGGRSLPATVFRRDAGRDLAALRLPQGGLPAVPVGESRRLRPGELILAVGNPLGVRGAVAVGVVSGRPQEVWVGGRRLPEMVQADVDLYPGNSGGPLVDARGRVVGINSMVTGPGMALAVPSHVAEQFLAEATPSRAQLGVAVMQVELPEALSRPLRSRQGLLVRGVVAGGPAERAGLLPGDLLVAMDGEKVPDTAELARRVSTLAPHRPTRLEVLRDGRILEVVAVPEERWDQVRSD